MFRVFAVVTALILCLQVLPMEARAASLDFSINPSTDGLNIEEQGAEQSEVDVLEDESAPPPINQEDWEYVIYALGASGVDAGGSSHNNDGLTELDVLIQIRDILYLFYAFIFLAIVIALVRFILRKGLGVFVRFRVL